MDYLGSADYLTSPVSGRVEAWTHYNEWGLIVHNAVLKCGQRELDLVKRYATHDFDSVLGMYYAKARFYDAHDRRFTAVDPILDPSGYDLREYVENPVQLVQYLYVGSNPIIFIDPLGLWYLKKDKNGTYFASAESYEEGLLKTFDFLGNAISSSGNMFTDWINGYTVVGGNSTNKYNSAIGIIGDYVEDKVKDTAKEAVVEKIFGEAIKEFLGPIEQLYDTITFFDRLEEKITIPKYDYIAFHLLDLAQISPKGSDMDRITLLLDSTYVFIQNIQWFFTAPVYTTFHRTALGGGSVRPGPTVFESLTVLLNMKKDGKTSREINAKINAYYNDYLCGNKSSNPVMNQIVKISDFSGTYLSNIYYQYLINYEAILDVIVDGFKVYINGILDYYDLSVA